MRSMPPLSIWSNEEMLGVPRFLLSSLEGENSENFKEAEAFRRASAIVDLVLAAKAVKFPSGTVGGENAQGTQCRLFK